MFLRAINVICFLITIATVIGSVELIIVSWTDFQIFQVCACQLAVCACCTVVYTWCVLWSRGKSCGCRPGQVFAPCMLPERRRQRSARPGRGSSPLPQAPGPGRSTPSDPAC